MKAWLPRSQLFQMEKPRCTGGTAEAPLGTGTGPAPLPGTAEAAGAPGSARHKPPSRRGLEELGRQRRAAMAPPAPRHGPCSRRCPGAVTAGTRRLRVQPRAPPRCGGSRGHPGLLRSPRSGPSGFTRGSCGLSTARFLRGTLPERGGNGQTEHAVATAAPPASAPGARTAPGYHQGLLPVMSSPPRPRGAEQSAPRPPRRFRAPQPPPATPRPAPAASAAPTGRGGTWRTG